MPASYIARMLLNKALSLAVSPNAKHCFLSVGLEAARRKSLAPPLPMPTTGLPASSPKITEWKRRTYKPACRKCVELVEDVVRPVFFDSYPEVSEYHDWVGRRVNDGGEALCLAWDAKKGKIVATRRRGGCGFSDMANNAFQSLLADIFKLSYRRMTREAYLGVKEDGSPSPLAGARFPVGLHDEPIAEILRRTAHISAPRIGELMEESGRDLAPDVFWKADPAISEIWSKDMEPRFDADGNLTLWVPAGHA